MCKMLGVSRSSFYKHSRLLPSTRALENQELILKIKEIHKRSRETYGSPRIHAELKAQGFWFGKNRVTRLMRENGIKGKVHRRLKFNPCRHYDYRDGKDLLRREFKTSQPNRVWVSDITYIPTQEGWLYLTVILDLFSRRVIGYNLTTHMRKDIVLEAFYQAYESREPAEGLIFHSDRGMQYISDTFQHILKTKGVLCSMSRKGNCFDNAVAESFFHTLKTELISRYVKYSSRAKARAEVFEYINIFYNNLRRHSALNYLTPREFEEQYGKS